MLLQVSALFLQRTGSAGSCSTVSVPQRPRLAKERACPHTSARVVRAPGSVNKHKVFIPRAAACTVRADGWAIAGAVVKGNCSQGR